MILDRLNHINVATLSIGDSVAVYRAVMGTTVIHMSFDLSATIAAASSSHYNVM